MLHQEFSELQKSAAELQIHAENLEKSASILGALAFGGALHMAPNLLMKAVKSTTKGHNLLTGSFSAGVDMGKQGLDLQHNMKNLFQYGVGPESLVEMKLGQTLGKRLGTMDEAMQQRYLQKLRGMAQLKMSRMAPEDQAKIQHVPVIGTFLNYMDGGGSDRVKNFLMKRTVPADQQPSLLNRAGDLGMLGATAAVNPHLLMQPAISAARKFVGESKFGQNFMKQQFANGKEGKPISKAKSIATDLLVSPAALDPYRIGRAANQHLNPAELASNESLVKNIASPGTTVS